jgi:hypothetical protein
MSAEEGEQARQAPQGEVAVDKLQTNSKSRQLVNRLLKMVRDFWNNNEKKFTQVWKHMDVDGKTKFARAVVAACGRMCPCASVLLPELNVHKIVSVEEHVYQLFWYYNNDDGFERDDELVDDLLYAQEVTGEPGALKAVRQMAILQTLTRLIDVYESIWNAGFDQKRRKEEADQLKQKLLVQQLEKQSVRPECGQCKKPAKNDCSGCRKIKYCSRECQTQHWSAHKAACRAHKQQTQQKQQSLKERMAEAKKRAKERQSESLRKTMG